MRWGLSSSHQPWTALIMLGRMRNVCGSATFPSSFVAEESQEQLSPAALTDIGQDTCTCQAYDVLKKAGKHIRTRAARCAPGRPPRRCQVSPET